MLRSSSKQSAESMDAHSREPNILFQTPSHWAHGLTKLRLTAHPKLATTSIGNGRITHLPQITAIKILLPSPTIKDVSNQSPGMGITSMEASESTNDSNLIWYQPAIAKVHYSQSLP